MKRERLQKLFSEDKEIFHGGMLFPTWICKGKEEIENRNIPQRAAVYLDIPIPCAGLLYYEKETCSITCSSYDDGRYDRMWQFCKDRDYRS